MVRLSREQLTGQVETFFANVSVVKDTSDRPRGNVYWRHISRQGNSRPVHVETFFANVSAIKEQLTDRIETFIDSATAIKRTAARPSGNVHRKRSGLLKIHLSLTFGLAPGIRLQ